MVRDWSREQFPRQQWHERFHVEAPPDETRYQEAYDGRRQPPLAIEKVLREHCGIPARYYYLAAVLDDGSQQTFSGPSRHINTINNQQLFNWNGFHREINRAESGIAAVAEELDSQYGDPYRQQFGSGYGSGSGERTRRTSEIYAEDEAFRPRKRNRGYRRMAAEEDDVPTVSTGSKRGLKIGDSQEVWKLYDQRFRNCQQTACKLIAKAWVKVVEPKKQTNHPYTGSDEKAPDWWPKPWGPTKEQKVRHKEPDHLYKRERVHLLCHILRMIVEPREKQHPSVQKLGLNVAKLREATDEALSLFFSGKDNEKNSQKKPFLDEVFKIARLEERYKNGEIDADTQAWVMSEEKFSEASQFDNEDGIMAKDEADHPSGTSSASPSRTVMTAHDGLMHGSSGEHSPTAQGHIQGSGFMNDMSVRGGAPQYTAQMLPPNMHAEQHFVENPGLQPSTGLSLHDMVPGPQDGHRRSSLYAPHADYSNSTSAGMYNQTWSGGSAAPGTAPMYSFPPQQPPPAPGQYSGHSGTVTLPQNQYMHTQYDTSLQRGNFDQGGMYRPATAATNPGGYPGYLAPDGRTLGNAPTKPDPLSRGGLD